MANVLDAVVGVLEEYGLLLESDGRLPSVAGIVAGEPIRGSWWAHPKGRTIYAVAGALADHPDAVVAKLLDRKVTYVHRRLWAPLLKVATCREAWQALGLRADARRLLRLVDAGAAVRTDQLPPVMRRRGIALDLEVRLLVHATEVHTEGGAHAKALETWGTWAARVGATPQELGVGEAKARLQEAAAGLAPGQPPPGLPWILPTRG